MTKKQSPVTLDRVNAIIHNLYASSIDPSRWASVHSEVMTAFDSMLSALVMLDTATNRFEILDSANALINAELDDYMKHYAAIDPRVAYMARVRSDLVGCDADWMDTTDAGQREFYDWQVKSIGNKHTLGAAARIQNRYTVVLATGRTAKQGPPERAHIELSQYLLPHFSRAAEIGLLLGRASATEALDALAVGIVLLDRQGGVTFANPAARAMAAASDGFIMAAGGVSCLKSTDRVLLQRLISAASPTQIATDRGGRMLVSRPSGKTPYIVSVSPWNALPVGISPPVVLISITDPALAPFDASATFGALFGLSRAEAALAKHLNEGLTLDEASAKLRLSKNTLRSQLRSIFLKTETNRQSDLIKLLSAALLSTPPPEIKP